MSKFYLQLWLKWAIRVSLCSIGFAAIVSLLISLFMYVSQGMPLLSSEVQSALLEITSFWFPLVWNLTLLFVLFRSIKYIFNSCNAGYKFELYNCRGDEIIEIIGYGDLVKVWRRWFMLIIWLVGSQMVFITAFTYMFTSYEGVFSWFNIYWLYSFTLLAGYLSFILLGNRCKRVKVSKC